MCLPHPDDSQRRRRFTGIRAKTLGGLAVLLTMLLATSAVLVGQSWLAKRTAQQAEIRNMLVGDLTRAALTLAMERGRTNVALAAAQRPPGSGRPTIPELRATADAETAQALRRLEENPGSLSAGLQAELHAALARVAELRRQVDLALAVPVGRRDPGLAAAWLPAISGLIEVIRSAIGEQAVPGRAIDAELQAALDARLTAFDLRIAAGERTALLAGVIGPGRPVDLDTAVQIGSRREATEQLWGRLLRLARSIDDPRLNSAVEAARRTYFEDYAGLLEAITASGMAGQPYPTDRAAYSEASMAALRRLDGLILAAQDIASEQLGDRARQAQLMLLGSIAAALVGIAVAGLTVGAVNRRVLRPIERITGAMRRLEAGWGVPDELPTELHDEMGEMSRAIAAFRDAMLASETALSEAERFTQQTMDALTTHVAVLDEAGLLIASNRSWRALEDDGAGPPGAREGQNYLAVCDRIAADGNLEVAAMAAGIRDVIGGVKPGLSLDYAWHGPAGRRWFRMRLTRFTGAGKVRVVVAHDDVTDRKLAADALQEKNRLLELAERLALTGHWRYDRETRALRWSREIYRIYGIEQSDEPPDPEAAMAAYLPDDRALFESAGRRAIETGRSFSLDLRLVRRDGELRDVEVLADCERDESGHVVALFGVFRDITERKRVAARLADLNSELERRVAGQTTVIAAREAYLRGILDNVAEMVVTTDEHGRIETFNPAAERAFGYGAAEVIGRSVPLLADGAGLADPAGAVETSCGSAAAPGRQQRREAMAVRKDGTRFAVELTVAEMDVAGRVHFIGAMRDITQRKRNERALLEQATLLRRAQELAGLGHWTWSRERCSGPWQTGLDYSDAVAGLFGVAPEELALDDDDYVARFVHPDDRAAVAAAFRDHWPRRRDRRPLEYRIVRPDGSVRHIREVTENVPAGAIEPDEVFGTIQDITERKEAETRLRRSEANLRAIFDHAPVTISLRDVAGRYVMVNRRFREVFGREDADILGRTAPEFYSERHVQSVIRGIEHVRDTRSVTVAEENAATVLGERRYLTTRFPILGEDGALTGIGSISVDVTGERTAEAALRESETRLRAIYESEPDCVALLARDGRLLEINPAGVAMLEAGGLQELQGHPMVDRVGDRHRREFRGMISTVFDGGSASLLFEAQGMAGGLRWLAANAVPMRDSSGAIAHMLMIARDVTAQRAVEEQLLQAQKMEAIGQLTGGIAHDFNNLLGVIVGNLDLLSLKLGGSSPEKDLVERAVGAAERGAALTHRLLAFARRQTLLPQNVDAGHLVTEMAQLLRRTLGERIALRTEIEPELMRCYVDPAQLETALLNLCLNARDAMPAGGILTVAARNGGADRVVVSVSDTGEGMSEAVRAHAFEPFFTTKGVGKGSGLGLSMVYGFVKQSGGHVEIASEPGRGTTVDLHLRAAATPSNVADGEGRPQTVAGAGQLVLVVEDDEPIRAFAVDALVRLGYRVVAVEEGAAALAALRDNPAIEVLFTDVVLPGPLDGFALAGRVKALRPDIRVLYTSGFADKDRLPAHLLDGDVDLLPKPYRVAELGSRIGRLFSKENA